MVLSGQYISQDEAGSAAVTDKSENFHDLS